MVAKVSQTDYKVQEGLLTQRETQEMGLKTYMCYDEIPAPIKSYVMTVSGVRSIYELDIFDINVFLREMNEYCDSKEKVEVVVQE